MWIELTMDGRRVVVNLDRCDTIAPTTNGGNGTTIQRKGDNGFWLEVDQPIDVVLGRLATQQLAHR